jgi:hypothetical protein
MNYNDFTGNGNRVKYIFLGECHDIQISLKWTYIIWIQQAAIGEEDFGIGDSDEKFFYSKLFQKHCH